MKFSNSKMTAFFLVVLSTSWHLQDDCDKISLWVKAYFFNSCNDCYCPKLTGEVCCPDEQHNRVSTGIGDSCCGRMPYSTSGNQICCAGRLHDGYGQQCCGGQIVSIDLECCGGEEEGMAYSRLPGKEPLSTFQ